MANEVFKFRGCDMAYYGTCTEATVGGVTTMTLGTPKRLPAITSVGAVTNTDSAASYGDNKPLIIVNSEGVDEITLSGFGIPLDVLADLTGKTWVSNKQMYVNGERTVAYNYLAWREKLTDGRYRYRVAYKGTFNIPETSVATEDDGTDSSGQDIVFTSIMTETVFTDGKSSKGYIVEDGAKIIVPATFFSNIKTQDTFALPA